MRRVSVVGFGKIGQAVAANILSNGIAVTGIDINPDLANEFQDGSYESGEPELQEALLPKFKEGTLKISSNFADVAESDAIIICIPLLVSKEKEIVKEPFLKCFSEISPFLTNNVLLVIETSIPIGFSRAEVIATLEANEKKHGTDFLLIHSPERIKSGSMLKQLTITPKVIGGINEEAADRGMEVYSWFFDDSLLHKVGSIETAEMIKLAGMVYRDINIGLANQLAIYSNKTGIDFSEVLELTNTDGEAHLLQPGIGVGGHCTPVYPYFLINNFKDQGMSFNMAIEGRDTNDQMAEYAVNQIANKVSSKKALILGLGFRPDVKEDTFSTSYLLQEALQAKEFEVELCDNLYSEQELNDKGFSPCQNLLESDAEVVFLVTPHEEFKALDWKGMYENGCRYFVDGRNVFTKEDVSSSGIEYIGIGN